MGSGSTVWGFLVVHGRLDRWTRRLAAALMLVAPLVPGFPVGPVVIAIILYLFSDRGMRRRDEFVVDRRGIVSKRGLVLVPRTGGTLAFPMGSGTVVFVDDGRYVGEIELDDESARDGVLTAMGYGTDPAPLRLEGAHRPELRAGLAVVASTIAILGFVMAAKNESVSGALVSAFVMVLSTVALLRRDTRIGHDGVWVAGPFYRRWIGFEELIGAADDGYWLTLHTETGDVAVSPPLPWPGRRARAARQAMKDVLSKAQARFAALPPARGAPPSNPTRVREGDFREPPVEADDLLAIVRDPKTPPDERVRAAGALALSDPKQHTANVRIAAEQCGSPRLEHALRCAAEGEAEAAAREVAAFERERC